MLPIRQKEEYGKYQPLEPPPEKGVWAWLKGLLSSFTSLFHAKVTPQHAHQKSQSLHQQKTMKPTATSPVISKRPSAVQELHAQATPKGKQSGGILSWVDRKLQAGSDYLEGESEPVNPKAKLQERGEKLERLGKNAAQLNAGAANFAEQARKLAEQAKKDAEKPWWQF